MYSSGKHKWAAIYPHGHYMMSEGVVLIDNAQLAYIAEVRIDDTSDVSIEYVADGDDGLSGQAAFAMPREVLAHRHFYIFRQ